MAEMRRMPTKKIMNAGPRPKAPKNWTIVPKKGIKSG
jgi:hypothetical protein